jgi:ABC-type sugar transport system substrate-binding protein
MTKLRYLVSLMTKDNDYQMEQAAAARAAAAELGVEAEVVYAENDAITQSTQLLKVIQAAAALRPNAIIVEPLGATPFPKVAAAAAAAGIGWAVINREAEYTKELRRTSQSPVFSVSVDQGEIGRIQGKQMAAFLPKGGSVLLIQGPSVSAVSRERYQGLLETLPPNVQLVSLRGKWTEESGHHSVGSWMKLMRAQQFHTDLICGQNDAMAMGAKKAINELGAELNRDVLSKIPITGCDGVPRTGQAWVRAGQMDATVIVPPSAGKAMVLMTRALQNRLVPAEHTFTIPEPFPSIESLKAVETR